MHVPGSMLAAPAMVAGPEGMRIIASMALLLLGAALYMLSTDEETLAQEMSASVLYVPPPCPSC